MHKNIEPMKVENNLETKNPLYLHINTVIMLAEKYINPFTDFGFKKLFGTEPNKDLLIDFLNEVILPQNRKITDLTYSKNDHPGGTESDRSAIFDLYCIGSNNERFVVEMQKAKQDYFKDRSVFYASFPIQEQAKVGGWNYQLSDVFTVGILDFVFQNETGSNDNKPKTVRHEVKLKDQDCKVFYDKLTFIYLEMPNFTKTEAQLETTHDKWLYVLKNLPNLSNRPAKLQEKIFKRLFDAAEIAKFTPKERELYEDSLKVYRDLKNVIDTAKNEGIDIGIDIGIEKGKTEEKTQGIIKALKRGKLSNQEIAEDFEVTVEFVLNVKMEGKF
jgi:predicted transposase/invertase (TIGR01784 family)